MNTSKILMLLLIPALGALPADASARPARPAAHAVVKKPAAHALSGKASHAASGKVAARVTASRTAGSRLVASRVPARPARAHAEPVLKGKGRKAVAMHAERVRAGGKTHQVLGARDEVKPRAALKTRDVATTRGRVAEPATREPRPVVIAAKPAPAAEAPVAQAADPAVRHDRKHHLPAQPAVPTPDAGKIPQPVAAGQASAALETPGGMKVDQASGTAEASAVLFGKNGRLVMPPAMKGSHETLVHQNVMADQDGLERVQDDDDLNRMRAAKTLLPIPDNAGLQTDDRLPGNRRFARPWTVKFLEAVAKAHYDRFHTALQVNSAVRTVEFQRNLIRVNGNAAPAEGETASPHLTGQAVDLAKKGLSMTEVAWLRGYLLPLVQQGKIDVEEEFQQSCFHISVYRKYVPEPAPRREITNRPAAGVVTLSGIAAAMR